MSKIKKIRIKGIVISVLLFILIFSVVFQLTIFNRNLQNRLIEKHSQRNNSLEEHKKILDFMIIDDVDLNFTDITKEEISHLEDVKNLNKSFKIFIIILMILLTSLILIKKDIHQILFDLWISLFLSLIFTTLVYYNSNYLFMLFHKIFFPQGNYLFPLNSFLITIYPENYFYDLFYISVSRSLFLILPLILVGYYLKKQFGDK